jgi:hypothetical protein
MFLEFNRQFPTGFATILDKVFCDRETCSCFDNLNDCGYKVIQLHASGVESLCKTQFKLGGS